MDIQLQVAESHPCKQTKHMFLLREILMSGSGSGDVLEIGVLEEHICVLSLLVTSEHNIIVKLSKQLESFPILQLLTLFLRYQTFSIKHKLSRAEGKIMVLSDFPAMTIELQLKKNRY